MAQGVRELKRILSGIFQRVIKNIVSLGDDSTLESDTKPLKVGGKTSPLELSETEVKVSGTINAEAINVAGKSVEPHSESGTIIGYTRLEGDLTNSHSYEIQNSLTVEDDTHKITFDTPASELVEISCECSLGFVSTSTRITVGLSDANATDGYNAVSSELEYNGNGISYSDGEADDGIYTFRFVLKASHLADIGSSNTFWVGFSTAGVTKTVYLNYGYRASHSLGYSPFVIKATTLPDTIYDGT